MEMERSDTDCDSETTVACTISCEAPKSNSIEMDK